MDRNDFLSHTTQLRKNMADIISNYNMAYVTNFKFEIPEASHINYFIQQVTLPSISMSRN